MKRHAGIVVGVALATALAGASVPATAAELNVGIIAPFTGGGAGTTGIPARDAAALVIGAINEGSALPKPYATAGFGGHTLAPIYLDEAGGNTRIVQEFRNLIQRRGANAVIGLNSSGSCLAVAPVAEELKALTVMFDCGTPRIFEDANYEYVFRPVGHGTMASVGAAYYVNEVFPQTKTIAGVNQNYAWGQDSWRDFEAAMKVLKPGTKVVASLFPKLFQGQYASEISSLALKRPDAIFTSMWGGDLESFMVQADARGVTRQSKFITSLAEIIMYSLAEKIPEGAIIGGRGAYGDMARDTPLNTWFRSNYQKKFNRNPTYPAYEMAQSVLFFKAAADKAQAANGDKPPSIDQIRAAMVGLEFESFSPVKMAQGKGHQAVHEIAYGRFKRDTKKGAVLTDVRYYPPNCVTPPGDMKTAEWLKKGMPGAEGCGKAKK